MVPEKYYGARSVPRSNSRITAVLRGADYRPFPGARRLRGLLSRLSGPFRSPEIGLIVCCTYPLLIRALSLSNAPGGPSNKRPGRLSSFECQTVEGPRARSRPAKSSGAPVYLQSISIEAAYRIAAYVRNRHQQPDLSSALKITGHNSSNAVQ